jgi:hypothetical protein
MKEECEIRKRLWKGEEKKHMNKELPPLTFITGYQ